MVVTAAVQWNEEKKKKKKKNEENLRDHWDSIKFINIQIKRDPEGEK